MDNYKRRDQISDEEIFTFKDNEINKIFEKIELKKQPSDHIKKLILISSMAIIMAMAIIVSLIINPRNPLVIQRVSAQEYIIESNQKNNGTFYVYYKAHIVYQNEIIPYNDKFGYMRPYEYVPQDIADAIDIDFNIFYINEYKYFLEVELEGDIKYFEIDYFPSFGRIIPIYNLNISSFEQDMNGIYAWIKSYPPVLEHYNVSNQPVYVPNPAIYELEDSREKQNYLYYVENFYINETDDPGSYSDVSPVFVVNNLVILNDNNEIDEISYHNVYTTSGINSMTIDDFINYQVNIYSLDDEMPFGLVSTFINHIDEGFILLKTGTLNDFRYAFAFCDIDTFAEDISQTKYVEITYRLHEIYDEIENSITLNTISYLDYIIIPPFSVVEEFDPLMMSLFNHIEFRFYDEQDNLIQEYIVDLN